MRSSCLRRNVRNDFYIMSCNVIQMRVSLTLIRWETVRSELNKQEYWGSEVKEII